MKNNKILISSISVILIIAAGLGGMKFFAAQKTLPENKPPVVQEKFVRALTVKNDDIPVKVTAFGRVGTAQPLEITSEVSGKIEPGNTPLKAGQTFKKGDILFKIEQNTALLNLKAQKSSFFNLVSGILPDLKIDFPDSYQQWQDYFQSLELDRDLPDLPETNSIKEKTFIASKNIYTSFYNIKSEEVRIKKSIVRAPYNGSVTDVFLEVGSYANLNSRIARIIRTDQMEIELPLELNQIKWIKPGAVVMLTNETGYTWKGSVKRIGSYVNPNTQSINVYIGIENNIQSPVYDGLYLKAEIIGIPASKVMEIPRSALFDVNKVYVIENEQLKIREVHIEKYNEETVLVSGLHDGDQVVPEPIINARENMQVKILQS